jgi:hypothetical protein
VTFTDLNLTTEYIQIQLGRNNIGPWMFVDEITFESASNPALGASVVGTNVPEVGSTLALLGIGISSLLMFRRRSS